MTTAPLAPGLLTVKDSQILGLLLGGASAARVMQVGLYRRTWTTDDVRRVMTEHGIRPPVCLEPAPEPPADRWLPPAFTDEPQEIEIGAAQADVLTHLCRGLGNAAIGKELRITEDTVKTHVRHLIAAFSARDRTHVAVRAVTGQALITVRPRRRKAA